MNSWIVAGLIAGVVAYLADWVVWSKVFTTGLESFGMQLSPEEMKEFSECFLTGSAAEVTPVSEIGPYRFKPGTLTETLMNAYADEVRGVAKVTA